MRKVTALATLLAVVGLVGGSMPVSASSLTYDDPKGDTLTTEASKDIVKITYEVKPTKPSPSIVVQMHLAAPPEQQLASYMVIGNIPGCGHFDAYFTPGRPLTDAGLIIGALQFWVGCGAEDDGTGSTSQYIAAGKGSGVKGNVITWSIALDSLPKEVRADKVIDGFSAYTQTADPVFGLLGNAALGSPDTTGTDYAESDKKFFYR